MARDTIERELSAPRAKGVCFEVATGADDADIRRLLRENPMPGKILLSFEREPDYFADASLPGESKQTIVARDGGRVVCVGSCSIRLRFVNGTPRRVGYLGGLRLDARHVGRSDVLRRGYEFFHELQADSPADFYFTSIAADNERARRFLERGLPRMPRYEFVGEFVTMVVPTRGRLLPWSRRGPAGPTVRTPDAAELVSRVNDCNRDYQFAPSWSVDEPFTLGQVGLQSGSFRCVQANGCGIAAGALWDQRAFKQTVIRGYAPWLTAARPVLNVLNHIMTGSRLPSVGETVANAFVSHLAVAPGDSRSMVALVDELRRIGAQCRIEFLTLGFAANDPRLEAARHQFRGREYRTRLYVVSWSDVGCAARALDGLVLAPEVALL
jgi:hypothetical protein